MFSSCPVAFDSFIATFAVAVIHANNEPFEYTKLKDKTTNIRLLKLLETNSDNDMVCEIVNFDFSSDWVPPFSAISYRWGPKLPQETIFLNNKEFKVNKTLFTLLKRLRELHRNDISFPQYVWIDAICIDQENVQERNHQVMLMGSIYSQASSVQVWLGLAFDDSDFAMDYIDQHCTRSRLPTSAASVQRLDKTLTNLLNREYWSRIWIIQEVILAKRLVLNCGSKSIEWLKFASFFRTIQNIQQAAPFRTRACIRSIQECSVCVTYDVLEHVLSSPARILDDVRSRYNKMSAGQSQNLDVLMDKFGTFNSTDPRDKVYGLLGLTENKIVVDYNKSAKKVFIDVMDHLLSTLRPTSEWGDKEAADFIRLI